MNAEEIKEFLVSIKKNIYLHKESEESSKCKERFVPYDLFVYLSMDYRKSGDPVAYIDYDARTKTKKGVNRYLVPKIVSFLSLTGNHHVINDVKGYFR